MTLAEMRANQLRNKGWRFPPLKRRHTKRKSYEQIERELIDAELELQRLRAVLGGRRGRGK